MTTIVRRRYLGMSSAKGICQHSDKDIKWCRNDLGIPEDDVYIRWGCTANLPGATKVINSAKGIHRVSDKAKFRQTMGNLCPRTWLSFYDVPDNSVAPWIVRPRVHAQGKQLWLCETVGELTTACIKAGPGCYISEYIPKVAEFRVFVHQGRVVWIAEKIPENPEAIAWNVAKGSVFKNVRWDNWNMEVINCALKVWELTGLHFSGIDIMLDADGKATCVEANSAPSQTSPYRQSCVAKAFDYMIDTEAYDRRVFPEVTAYKWRDAIHPGIWSNKNA